MAKELKKLNLSKKQKLALACFAGAGITAAIDYHSFIADSTAYGTPVGLGTGLIVAGVGLLLSDQIDKLPTKIIDDDLIDLDEDDDLEDMIVDSAIHNGLYETVSDMALSEEDLAEVVRLNRAAEEAENAVIQADSDHRVIFADPVYQSAYEKFIADGNDPFAIEEFLKLMDKSTTHLDAAEAEKMSESVEDSAQIPLENSEKPEASEFEIGMSNALNSIHEAEQAYRDFKADGSEDGVDTPVG